ncbi:TonB-dependent receptor [Novosphingobium sp. PC22D]|uniref:TonB-dependent receptor plug domain-containing protein n=1 Tax=Novosphingobium sp. PC22D TaxID=1962403 RepID=UPI000BF01D99|nr:TonB-dependent receptor [Novosphingobium sp. PC22D]PEQ12050.1 TonB-dependent receptor [Novosphingobium sp. PC22D]
MKYLFLLSSALVVASPAMAQESDIVLADRVRDDLITVTATGTGLVLTETGQAISVIGGDEINSIQGPDIARVLERLPGVTLARNGGLGGFTGLFVRGANSQQVLVLVDGVRVADVAAPGGGFDFGNLASGPIGKIELLRGSNSVAWGSEAIGGVVAVTTRELEGVEASAEYGARDSVDGQVNGGLVGERYAVSLGGGYTRTDGISQAATGSEADAYRQWRGHGRARVDLAPGLSARLVGRYIDSKLDIDGYPAPAYTFADTPEYQKSREWGGRAGLSYDTDALSIQADYQLSDTRRRYYDPTVSNTPTSQTHGRAERAEMRGKLALSGPLRLDFGGDHEWSRFGDGNQIAKARLASGHGLLGWYGDVVNVAAGLRYDDHSRFGGAWTFGANGSVTFAPGWRLRASFGEGFKTPTLYQLFSEYGNPALSPERSRSYDAGIEYGDRNGPLHLAATVFRRDTRNLIDYVSCFSASDALCEDGRYGFYANVGKARASGVELEMGAQVSERLRAQAAYTYLEATDRTEGGVNRGNDLARRPRHAVTVSMDWTAPVFGLKLGGDIRMVGDSFDNAANSTRIDGYALGTLRAALPVTEAIELYGRIENVTDADYATTAGYGTPGRSAFIGARARF